MNIYQVVGSFQCPEWGYDVWHYIKFAHRDCDWALAQNDMGEIVAISENEEIWDVDEIFEKFPEWR